MSRRLLILLVALLFWMPACNSHEPGNPQVSVVGALNTKLTDRLATTFDFVPYKNGSDRSLFVQGADLASLTAEQKQGLFNTYQAGWAIVVFDPDGTAIDAVHDIIDPSHALVRARPSGGVKLLASIIRKSGGRHHPHHISDPHGSLTNYDSALDSAVQLIGNNLGLDQVDPKTNVSQSSNGLNVSTNPAGTTTLSIPQPNNGVFSSNIAVYAFHDCCGEQDIYVMTSQLDLTPGSTYLSAWGSAIVENADGSKSVDPNGWKNEFIPSCGANSLSDWPINEWFAGLPTDFSVSHSDSACKLIDYPLWYYIAMEPPATLQSGDQCNFLPSATQGVSTETTTGFSFSIDGGVGYYGEGAEFSPGADISATWETDTTVNVPATLIASGKTQSGQGQYWQMTYCGLDSTTGCNNQGIGEQKGKLDCTDALAQPQQGQTPGGSLGNISQEVFWKAGPQTRVGSSFDINVTLAVDLANSQMNVWDKTISAGDPKCPTCTKPGGGNCSDTEFEACGCATQTASTYQAGVNQQDPAALALDGAPYQSFTFQIPFPPTAQDSTCPADCTKSEEPTSTSPGCVCICPVGACPTVIDSGCPSTS